VLDENLIILSALPEDDDSAGARGVPISEDLKGHSSFYPVVPRGSFYTYLVPTLF
jgi:hypothetical protein